MIIEADPSVAARVEIVAAPSPIAARMPGRPGRLPAPRPPAGVAASTTSRRASPSRPSNSTTCPEPVREAARKAIPGVKLDEAWKNLDREGKLHSYEIRGRNPADGKIREVRVSLTGEILETE